MRYIKWIIGIPLIIMLIAFAHYNLPGRDVVQIVGTDVKRMDIGTTAWFWASQDAGTNKSHTRDVRFINAIWPNGAPRVYRNEDTNWNWPPYFKFNSSNLNARTQAIAKEDNNWVAITHYGWRIQLLSIFPNAVKVERVSGPDVFLIPWFNIAFLAVVGLMAYGIFRIVRRFKRRSIDPVLDQLDDMVDDVGEKAAEMHSQADEASTGVKAWFKRWFG